MSAETPVLLPQHQALIDGSRISPEVARARGYRSVTVKADLERRGFASSQRSVPTLLIPIYNVFGDITTYQSRPDTPRVVDGKALKYETPKGSRMVLDVPSSARPLLKDPARPLFITEGVRKADAAVSQGLCTIDVLGVWGFRGTNAYGGKLALADWEAIALNGRETYIVFDSDVMVKRGVHGALVRLKAFLEGQKAAVRVIYLPPGPGGVKQGLDDFFAADHGIADLLALATDVVRTPPDAEDEADGDRYLVDRNCICRKRLTRDGIVIEPLCNFTATVTEELTLDDGVECTRAFQLEGRLATGETLPQVRVTAARFPGMGWVTEHWGLRAIVNAGLTTKDALREGIQRLSPEAPRRHVFTHTGWRDWDGEWIYLTANGAVGQEGFEVDLSSDLARYHLPRHPDDPAEAMRRSLQLLTIAPLRITAVLWAAVFRAVLASILSVDASIWLSAPTGFLKSTLVALFLSHYGNFVRTHLPGNWTSTANQLEHRAFLLKDVVFVIDDWAPSGLDRRELETKAARLLRAQGNLAGRGRLRADITERPGFVPRGLIVSTGEQQPPGQSIIVRLVLVEMERADVDLAALTVAQREADRLPHALAGFITWLTPQMPTLPQRLRQAFEDARAHATAAGEHLRIPEAIAHLWIGADWALQYAEEIGACSVAEVQQLRDQVWTALIAVARSQSQLVETERPSRRFLTVLAALVTQGKAAVVERSGSLAPLGGIEPLGWQDEEALYLIPDAAYRAVTRFCQDTGEPFPVRFVRLLKDLAEEGLSDCDAGRHTATVKIGGHSHRVLKLMRSAVVALLGQDIRSPDGPWYVQSGEQPVTDATAVTDRES